MGVTNHLLTGMILQVGQDLLDLFDILDVDRTGANGA